MNRILVYLIFLLGTCTAFAAAPPPTSLNNCQNAVKVATAAFVKNKVAAIGGCLQTISTQIVKNNAPDAHAAAATCVAQFRKINDSRGIDKQLSDKLAAAIVKKCDPSYQTPSGSFPNTHTLADIIGAGAGVAQPLHAENLNAWCSHYGGDGSIDGLQEWIDCLTAAAECDVDSTIASQYPRALEWMNLVKPSMQALSPPVADPTKVSDAVAGLDAVKAEIDGPSNDNIASIQCGGIVSSGSAVASNCLAGATFSNGTAGGLTGAMPNNGAVTLTPSTTDQTIVLGFHNGSGKCVGDSDLVSGNIKSGANLFGVNGSSTVIDTSGATATAADMVSGKTAYANGSLVTGSVTAGSNVSGANGLQTFTIPDGLYSGSKTVTANDTNLVAGNIKKGSNIFGVTGTAPPPPMATGETTSYVAGDDGALQKGAPRSYTDNGDGTITDNTTGLMWEKKLKLDGATDGTNLHDADNYYQWAGSCTSQTACSSGGTCCHSSADCVTPHTCTISDGQSTGLTIFGWVAQLNSANFAGHNDWRIPNVNELQSIVGYQMSNPSVSAAFQGASCGGACTNIASAVCSCTQSDYYWSSSTYQNLPFQAWYVYFYDGYVSSNFKPNSNYVRAVRGGS